ERANRGGLLFWLLFSWPRKRKVTRAPQAHETALLLANAQKPKPPLPQPLSRKREREAALRGRGRRAHASALRRRAPQRRGGTAHHQLRTEALVAFLQRLAIRRALQVADQPLRRVAGDFLGGLARGGERGPGLLGERAVFEAGDGEFPRHAEAAGVCGGEHAGGDLVVGAEDRGGAVLQREQLARAAEAVVEGIVAGQDQLAVQRDAVVLQRVLVALVALGAGAVVAAAPQEADAGVAKLDQVLGDRVGGVAVVHVDAGVAVLRVLPRGNHPHERDLRRRQLADQLGLLGHRRRQHQAGQPRVPDQRDQLFGQPRGGGIAGMDLQAVAALAAGRQHAALHADDVVRVRVVVDQAHRVGARAAQAARGGVGPVAQRVDRALHLLSRARVHRGLVVDDPRDRLQRDARLLGYILDGGAAQA